MNALLQKSLSSIASAAFACALVGTALGQSAKVEGGKPSFDDLQSPEFSGGNQKRFKPKDWLEIETDLKVMLSPEPNSKTLDRLLIKWYVAVENPERKSTMLLLTKDVEHVNIPLGEEVYSSIYISPAAMRALTGGIGGGKRVVKYVGYEVLVNGEKVASETSKGSAGWWSKPSAKISRSEAVPILDKTETPFANMWWDRYLEVGKKR